MEIKTFELTTAAGKRNVKLANHFRKTMYDKIASVLKDAGFEVVVAANGELAIPTAQDATSGDIFYTRLGVSFTNKALDSKVERKVKEVAEVELPDLFDAE